MKSEVINVSTFKPVTISLTFETEKELEVFKSLCLSDIFVPAKMFESNRVDVLGREIMADVLSNLTDTLRTIK